jgi:hypothetical protein
MVFSWLSLIRLLVLAGLAAFGLWALRRPPAAPPRGRTPRRVLWFLLAVLAVTLGVRALLIPTLPPGTYELENVPYDRILDELTDQIGFEPLRTKVYHSFHTPLLPTFLDAWFPLGDVVGMGGSIIWLRLPNLFLAAAFMLLLVRLGRAIGAPAAGWGAAAVFAVSPTLAPLSVYQGHYFLEVVTVTWFCERLAVYALEGRAIHRSLAAAAAVALWTGYMASLVVAPGMVLYLVVAWRRGERERGLATILVVAALFGPIATAALETAADFLTISVTGNIDHAVAEGMFAVHGHHPMPVEMPGLAGFLGFPGATADVLFGHVAAGVALALALLALVLRPRAAWFALLVVILFAGLSTRMAARWVNFTAVYPFLLVAPLWGAVALAQRLRASWAPGAVAAAVAAVLVVGPAVSPPRQDRLPAPGDIAGWVSSGDRLSQIAKPLQEEQIPVLVLAVEKDVYYHTCPDRVTVAGYLACKDEYYQLPWEDGFRRGRSGGRPLAFTIMEDIGPQSGTPCPRTDAFARDPDWHDTPFFALVTPEFLRYEADGLCQDTFRRTHCDEVTQAVGIHLYRCPPAW